MLKARLFATNITSAMDTRSGSRAAQNTRVVKTTLEINSDPGYTGSASEPFLPFSISALNDSRTI